MLTLEKKYLSARVFFLPRRLLNNTCHFSVPPLQADPPITFSDTSFCGHCDGGGQQPDWHRLLCTSRNALQPPSGAPCVLASLFSTVSPDLSSTNRKNR